MKTFACHPSDGDLVRACAPEQPDEVKVEQTWMNVETGDSYPVRSVKGEIISGNLVRLGSDSYAILLSEADLRDRYVCTDPPRDVTEIRPT